MSFVVLLNGWPGTGKKTIALELARRTGARVIDNHAMIDPAEAVFDRDHPSYPTARVAARELVLGFCRDLPDDLPLIFTVCQSDRAPDPGARAAIAALARARASHFFEVILEVEEAENLRRLAAPGRAAQRKLTDPGVLSEMRRTRRLSGAGEPGVRQLDVTALAPAEAAEALQAMVGLAPAVSSGRSPADDGR